MQRNLARNLTSSSSATHFPLVGYPCDTVGVALDACPIVLTRSESDYSKVRQWTIEIVQQIKEGGGGAAAILSPSRGGNAPRNLIGNEKTMLALLFTLFAQQRLLDCLVSISLSSWFHAPRWTRVMGGGPNTCDCPIRRYSPYKEACVQ